MCCISVTLGSAISSAISSAILKCFLKCFLKLVNAATVGALAASSTRSVPHWRRVWCSGCAGVVWAGRAGSARWWRCKSLAAAAWHRY